MRKRQIWNMYHSFNASGNGHMTREEFHKGIGSTGIGVDAGGLTADELFDRYCLEAVRLFLDGIMIPRQN